MALQLEGCIEEPGVCWVLKYGEDFDGLGQNEETRMATCRECRNYDGSRDWLELRLPMGSDRRKGWGG